ncbi:MAG: glycosyltransferase family 9 protein [Bacteroidetes bacterium]|nr:glycosyltransferase family 9 protein [Bacteroidota bacterium]
MKTSTKIIIDKFAGGFIVFLLNSLDKLLRPTGKKSAKSPEKIIVCKFLGMGSIIQSTPLLMTLKKQFPEVKVVYLSTLSNKKFLEQISVIDELIIINDKFFFSTIISSVSSIKLLFKIKADVFIDLETHSHFSKIFTILSGALLKFGLTKDAKGQNNIYSITSELHIDRPVSESYLQMCSSIINVPVINELYNFTTTESDFQKLKQKLSLPENYIIINPNASDLRIERRWPKEKYSSLVEKIIERYPDCQSILIGSTGEAKYVREVLEGVNSKFESSILNTAGKLSIEELTVLISRTKLMITNDTGPMHLSFAAHQPTIALFGPASPVQFGNHPSVCAVYKKVECSPCVHDHIKPPCQGNNICMKQIEVTEVFEAAVMKLS